MSVLADFWRGYSRMERDARLWVAAWALASFGGFGVQAVLLNLYLARMGYGPEFIGLFQSLGQLASLAMCLPGVAVGRRIGHRNAMLASVPLLVLCSVTVLLSEGLPLTLRPTWLAVSWMLGWAAIPVFLVNSDPYIMLVTRDDTRRYAYAGQAAALAGGAFSGALVGGWLPGFLAARLGLTADSALPFRLALTLVPLVYTALLFTLLFIRRERAAERVKVAGPRDNTPLGILLAISGLVLLMRLGSGVVSFINLYLDDALAVPTARIGALMGAAELVPILLALALPLLLARWGAGRTLAWAGLCTALALLVLGLFSNRYAAGASYLAAALAWRVHFSTRALFAQQSVHPRWRGTISACVEMGSSLGMMAAAFLGGRLIAAAGYRWLFLAAAGVSLTAIGLLALFLRRQERIGQPQEEVN